MFATPVFSGTLFALAAGLMWGLVFVGPLLLPEYPAALQAFGRYLAFGLCHAAGVIANHYYTLWLKRALGAPRLRAYLASAPIHAVAVVTTYLYVAASFALFANDGAQLAQLWRGLRGAP